MRTTHTPIGPVIDALREVAQEIGFEVAQVAVGMYPKVKFRAPAASGGPDLRIKVEINTYETSPARPLIHLPFALASSWFTGSCSLQTFTAAELVSTKLRALYQRSKGRDVVDLWLGLDQLDFRPGCRQPAGELRHRRRSCPHQEGPPEQGLGRVDEPLRRATGRLSRACPSAPPRG